ncbi:MAG: transposase [Cyanobacteriota bacterium]|nr:transposase [Cyanobacteriota bacterium]
MEPQRRVYVDESGFGNREDYPYGYSLKGERCYALKSGKRTERVSWITALRDKTLFGSNYSGGRGRREGEVWRTS